MKKKPVKKPKFKTLELPPIPIGHLKIAELQELRDAILRITGYELAFEVYSKTGKKLGEL